MYHSARKKAESRLSLTIESTFARAAVAQHDRLTQDLQGVIFDARILNLEIEG